VYPGGITSVLHPPRTQDVPGVGRREVRAPLCGSQTSSLDTLRARIRGDARKPGGGSRGRLRARATLARSGLGLRAGPGGEGRNSRRRTRQPRSRGSKASARSGGLSIKPRTLGGRRSARGRRTRLEGRVAVFGLPCTVANAGNRGP
jgi:hypothetical protein